MDTEMHDESRQSTSRVDVTESWKAFGNDTEAGRLLKKLYCGNAKPKVSYPKVKTKPRGTAVPFIPGGGANQVDSRTHALAVRVSDRAINAPSFTGGSSKSGGPEMHPIDYHGGRRKPFSEIEKEINAIKRQMDAYRVATIKRKPNVEKQKLQQAFEFGHGSILPRELLPGAELLDRELAHATAQRNGRQPKSRVAQLEELYDLVLDEIEQRKQFISDMLALGHVDRAAPIEREILDRMRELRRVHELLRVAKAASSSDNNATE